MSSSPPESRPRAIGRYEVEKLLGQGGMGRVWLARDTILGRRVAVKVLRDDLALPPPVRDELTERMRHEARAAAAVSHPHIVTLHDMGEDPDVGLYLVFEYVPGPSGENPESLRDRLRAGPMPLVAVGALARELGSALSFAHGAGVIHRDVKPENILFSRTGAKIADFGIARIPDSNLTRANTVLGTPAYTAPEALSNGVFGPPSDQFALAATLYEAATGRRAFAGDDAMAVARKVSSEPPPPIDGVGPAAALRGLESALRRGLAKSADERYGSAEELGDAVDRAVTTAGPTETAGRGRAAISPPEPLTLERTPLGSRAAISAPRLSDRTSTMSEATQRPSIVLRQRTHRFQNVAAAAALLVIIALVLLGRRGGPTEEPGRDASAATGVIAPPPVHPSRPPPARSVARPATAIPSSALRAALGRDASDAADGLAPSASATPRDE